MTDAERKELKLEIKGRKIVVNKLETALKALNKKVDKIEKDRQNRKETLLEYKDESELQDAYGWGFITEDEYDKLIEAMRKGVQTIDEETSPEEIAKHIIQEWLGRMRSDIYSFEYDLLPPEKQAEIMKKNEEILQKRKERMKNNGI